MLLSLSLVFALTIFAVSSYAVGPKVSELGNKHNFSYKNTGVNFRAANYVDDVNQRRTSQICVFCHTPHNSSTDGPLWGRQNTTVTFFKHFSSSSLVIDNPTVTTFSEYGQPNGSSRLCLSCHDGVTALSALIGDKPVIKFLDARNNITSEDVHLPYQTFSSHHPVSFKYTDVVITKLGSGLAPNDNGYSLPLANSPVKLDKEDRMQCTTCHNPHQDQSNTQSSQTPFWVGKDLGEVCYACHVL
jgi:predicted CXXCH cytochrome family protein